MAVRKRPAPKRLTKPERLAILLDKRLPSSYDVQRLEWLKVIAEERGILKPRLGLYGVAHDWLFELAYALAVEMYDGSELKGRPPAPLQEDVELVLKVREARRKHPNDSQSASAARVLGINPKLTDRKRNRLNANQCDAVWKRYLAAEARLAKKFTK